MYTDSGPAVDIEWSHHSQVSAGRSRPADDHQQPHGDRDTPTWTRFAAGVAIHGALRAVKADELTVRGVGTDVVGRRFLIRDVIAILKAPPRFASKIP